MAVKGIYSLQGRSRARRSGGGSVFTIATGGTISRSGSYKIHAFNSSTNFVVSQVGTAPYNTVEYLIVAGGGAGGIGGGGAGGLLTATGSVITVQTHSIIVGAGGTGAYEGIGTSGVSSSFNGIASTGGGYGGYYQGTADGGSGGSGGGAGHATVSVAGDAVIGQGFKGGRNSSATYGGAGGGGASQAGGNSVGNAGANGGSGSFSIMGGGTGSYYAGGGGGGGGSSNAGGIGGIGGGGAGISSGLTGNPGATNKGGGGGGRSYAVSSTGGNGGSGIVIIKYYSPVDPVSVWRNVTDSNFFCAASGNTNINIYTPTYTTLANIYSNSANIYTNSDLTTLAAAGFYGTTNGGGTWYEWDGSIWINTGSCQRILKHKHK